MTQKQSPSYFCPQFSEDHINTVGNLIMNSYERCGEYFDSQNGDTSWSHNCRTRDWTRNDFRNAIKNLEEYSFLRIIQDKGQCFVLTLDGIPIKFLNDKTREPSKRGAKKRAAVEVSQMSLLQYAGIKDSKIAWRFLIERLDSHEERPDLRLVRVAFVGIDEFGSTVCHHDIKRHTPIPTIFGITPIPEVGVELEAPFISKKKEDTKEAVNAK